MQDENKIVTLVSPELSDNVTKDKFLVMCTDATDKDPNDLIKLWKETPREEMIEHKWVLY